MGSETGGSHVAGRISAGIARENVVTHGASRPKRHPASAVKSYAQTDAQTYKDRGDAGGRSATETEEEEDGDGEEDRDGDGEEEQEEKRRNQDGTDDEGDVREAREELAEVVPRAVAAVAEVEAMEKAGDEAVEAADRALEVVHGLMRSLARLKHISRR